MRFYVFRTGSNAANQPMTTEAVCVAVVEAASEEEACQLAAQRVTVYNNQYLHAEECGAVEARERAIDAAVEVLE